MRRSVEINVDFTWRFSGGLCVFMWLKHWLTTRSIWTYVLLLTNWRYTTALDVLKIHNYPNKRDKDHQ